MTELTLPEPLGRGCRSPVKHALYEAQVAEWAGRLLDLKPRVDFDPGVRGWCYLLEPHGLAKGDFDRAQLLINNCRKSGLLPLNFTSDDDGGKRESGNVEEIDDLTPEEKAEEVATYVETAQLYYDPISFWEFQDSYVEMAVEKSGLKNLFDPICARHHVALANTGGSWSINQRAAILRRFAEWQAKGKQCVLLNCGDHDPYGLRISTALRKNLADILPALKRTYPETAGFDLDAVHIQRFGLNFEFIEAQGLSWINNLLTASGKDLADPNHRKHGDHDVQDYIARFGVRKVEAEALVVRPDAGRALCEAAILQYIDQDGIEDHSETLEQKREELREHIAALMNGAAR